MELTTTKMHQTCYFFQADSAPLRILNFRKHFFFHFIKISINYAFTAMPTFFQVFG